MTKQLRLFIYGLFLTAPLMAGGCEGGKDPEVPPPLSPAQHEEGRKQMEESQKKAKKKPGG